MVAEGRLGDIGTLCKLIDRDLVDRLFLGDQLDKGSADPFFSFFRHFCIVSSFHFPYGFDTKSKYLTNG